MVNENVKREVEKIALRTERLESKLLKRDLAKKHK
jgi:hypothetical protein